VDQNQFEDNRTDFMVMGNSRAWWQWEDLAPPVLGSEHALFAENNTTNFTGAAPVGYGLLFSTGQGGGPFVYRYNTITNYALYDIMDAHGNQEAVIEENNPTGQRGTISLEVYNNSITSSKIGGHRILYHRGGTAIVYNNTLTGDAAIDGSEIVMIEEDGCVRFDFLDTYPGMDSVKNTYYYNNTVNGNAINTYVRDDSGDDLCAGHTNTSTFFLQQNRDYWLTDPVGATIGGRVYNPYDYPHPMSRPSPPVNVRIAN